MFEFESAMKLIVTFGVGAFTLMMTGIGIKILFFRKRSSALPIEDERVAELEAKLGELEERVDFTERMLAEVRARPQLPGKP
ncbi:MAG: hypothetical protein ABR537_02185 [Gemmatimonadales bacterium]